LTNTSASETSIAVNPTNPLNLVAGAICSPFNCSYSSSDGGQTWTQVVLTPMTPYGNAGDPAVAFCGDGSVVYASLSVQSIGGGNYRSAVYINRSTNGGLSWSAPSLVVERNPTTFLFVVDKPWIACDTTGSAFANRIYVEWTDGAPTGRIVKVKRSTDFGGSWSAEVIASDSPQKPQNQAVLAVGPTGNLYIAWDWVANAGENFGQIRFDKSTDGGMTFGTNVPATTFTGINPDPHFRRLTYPAMDVDRTSGPRSGRIYIAWADNQNGDGDIFVIRSTDGGVTWSSAVRVNDDAIGNGADQWAQWIAVDPKGRVIVTFSDRRRFIGGTGYEVWGAISRDGGDTFDTNFLIADTPSDAPTQTFLGDYDGLAVTNDRLHPTWADRRPGLALPPDPYTDAYPNIFDYDEVTGVVWLSNSDMSFDTQDARFGVDLDYDVVGGLLSELRTDLGFGRAACVAPAWPAPPLVDLRLPPSGDGYYYLVRAHGPAGVGTYGDGSPARPNVRDPLDETLVTCP
jgi:hypothetical protein